MYSAHMLKDMNADNGANETQSEMLKFTDEGCKLAT